MNNLNTHSIRTQLWYHQLKESRLSHKSAFQVKVNNHRPLQWTSTAPLKPAHGFLMKSPFINVERRWSESVPQLERPMDLQKFGNLHQDIFTATMRIPQPILPNLNRPLFLLLNYLNRCGLGLCSVQTSRMSWCAFMLISLPCWLAPLLFYLH